MKALAKHLPVLALCGAFYVAFAPMERLFAASFYDGKTIRIIVGFAALGGFDTYSRAIARHMGKRIPGNPTVTVENMAGAGSLCAANHLYGGGDLCKTKHRYKEAEPDGLTIGNFIGSLISQQLLGYPGIEFDARKFEYLGVAAKDNVVCALTKASGITSMEQWMASKTPVKLGGTAPGSNTDDVPKILKAALGLPVQVVLGYKGTADIRLAAERGEVAGGCWPWELIKFTWRKALEAGDVLIVLQATPRAHPDLPNVPLAINFAKTDEARFLIQAGIHDPNAITRLYVLPPGTPRERVQILRRAFMDTMKDSQFLEEAEKVRLTIDPLSGEEVERIVNGLFKLDPALVGKLKEVLK